MKGTDALARGPDTAVFSDTRMAGPRIERHDHLERLRRLIRLHRDEVWSELNDVGRRLVQNAAFSAYCDCLDAGLKADAAPLLAQLPATPLNVTA